MKEVITGKTIKNLLKESKGYFLLSSLTTVPLILLILSPKNLYGWGLFFLLLVRTLCLKKRSLLFCTLVILAATVAITIFHIQNNQTKLPMETDYGQIIIDPNHFKVEDCVLSGVAKVVVNTNSKEKVAFFYRIPTKEEKEYFLNLKRPILMDATINLKEPEKARNRYVFDYHDYLFFKKIHWSVQIKDIHSIKIAKGTKSRIAGMRMDVLDVITKRIPESKLSNYTLAMLFNQNKGMETDVLDSYQKIGLIHLFSISGMHIQFLMRYLKRILLSFKISRERINPLLLFSILLYGVVTGGGVGISRAIGVNSFLLIAEMFHIKMETKDAFAFILLITLWINPYFLFSLSFQLSYALSGVLYMIAPRLQQMKSPTFIRNSLLSIIMTVVSFPFLSYHFFEMNWMSIFVNIFFAFFFSACIFTLLWLTVLLTITPLTSKFIFFIQFPLQYALIGVEWLSKNLADNKWFLIVTGRQGFLASISIGVVILVCLLFLEMKKNLLYPTVLLIVSILLFNLLPVMNPKGRVIALDVGQGDSILFITPFHQQAILIDTGGKVVFGKDCSEKSQTNNRQDKDLVSAIKAEGISKLDAVILTHKDFDHTGSLAYLADEIKIDHLYFPKGSEQVGILQKFLMKEKNRKTILHPLLAGSQISHGSLHFEVLWPHKPGPGENDDSVVLLSKIGGLVWLFTGDLELHGEKHLLQKYPNLRCDVLKVGHHGSKTSTNEAFLESIKPSIAIVSAGKNNQYGHPHAEVVDRLTQKWINIFRTDQQGAIHFSYKGKDNEWSHVLQ